MSNTDVLRDSEADLLPPGYARHIFTLNVGEYQGKAEVDGFNANTFEAIEINQSETTGVAPKPGQKRKLASDVLKLIFLKQLGLISRGRVFISSREMYTWCHQTGSWLNAATRHYGITIELKEHDNKRMRKKVRHALSNARKENHA